MTERTKKIFKISALGLCAAVLVSACVVLPQFCAERVAELPTASSGMQLENAEDKGISVTSAEISPAEYDDYGIMPIAEKAYTLTATVNGDATTKAVDWTVAFQDPASAWATGKTVTDYVTASSTGALTATVQCLQPFGEQILVSAVSRDNPTAKATCTCDYLKRLVGADITMTSDKSEHSITRKGAVQNANLGKIHFGDTYEFSVLPVFTDGTIDAAARVYFYQITFSVPQEAAAELAKNGFVRQGSGEVNVEFSSPSKAFDNQVLSELFGPGTLEDSNSLLKALKAVSGTYTNLIKATVGFVFDGGTDYDGPRSLDFYFDIDADSVYIPVVSVELSQESILF